ncbi:MAG: hypothetical protein M3N12_09915 [Verrucomicrobiota bacterium]|nr:hypothetical protein [Verrucomicrobiota bacterium]
MRLAHRARSLHHRRQQTKQEVRRDVRRAYQGWRLPVLPDFYRARPAQKSAAPVLLKSGSMILMHSRPKEQREAIRQLVHSVLTRDMGTFNPERFKEWIKDIDARFRKVGLTLRFTINQRTVSFTIKEIRSGRTAFKFSASSHVPFDDRDVVMKVEELGQKNH